MERFKYYVIVRTIAAAFSLRLSDHVQFIRPLVYPMVKEQQKKKGTLDAKTDEKLKALLQVWKTYGNFYGQNVFIASSGVLLIVGTLKELGITNV